MIKIEKTVPPGSEIWEAVVRGCRNPFDSWAKSDSYWDDSQTFILGKADHALMFGLATAGDDHGKFLRMLPVITDITAALHVWKQLDTYKVGTVTNSCSTMHKIMAKPFTVDDFSWEHLGEAAQESILQHLNLLRRQYLAESDQKKKEELWYQVIEFLPESYLQKRTWYGNYQVLKHIYHARKGHKLADWEIFRTWVEGLPYSEFITGKVSDEPNS